MVFLRLMVPGLAPNTPIPPPPLPVIVEFVNVLEPIHCRNPPGFPGEPLLLFPASVRLVTVRVTRLS
jgi:hypothetical protein